MVVSAGDVGVSRTSTTRCASHHRRARPGRRRHLVRVDPRRGGELQCHLRHGHRPLGSGTISVGASNPVGVGTSTGSFTFTPSSDSGYDLVGQDGGVFVFPTDQSGGFFGSLPGLGVHVDDIAGMVPSPDDRGYFLVGRDGGVFSFGDAPFLGSLPGIHVAVDDIRGIVPTRDNRGYFLVGSDGGVFAFGDAPFLGSLPGEGIHIGDVTGIAATPSDQGYWVVAGNGTVYAFGDAPNFGSATGTPSPVSGIASTPDGGGYWIVTQNGSRLRVRRRRVLLVPARHRREARPVR